jgi:selenocysteine-specific elongation factor
VRSIDLDGLAARIPVVLAPHAAGLAPDKLLAALPGTGAAVLDEAVARLVSRGLLAKRGGQLVVPRPEEDRARARNEVELAAQIVERLQLGGLAPPDPKAIVTDLAAKHAVDRLLRDGVVVRAVDRAKGREILFHRDAVEQARRVLTPLLEGGAGLAATEIAAALGVSRKYAMPLLDHLDTIRFTRREGDLRTPGSAFAAPN